MLVIRPAEPSDLDALVNISHATGPGMTSMPADRSMWQRRLLHSEASFSTEGDHESGTYFMVLEDTETKTIAGSTAIYSGVGRKRPFYSYKLSTLVNYSSNLDCTVTHRVLHLVNDYTGVTEIGSLYLAPAYRRDGNGSFLSRSRYLVLSGLRGRFADVVIAEMRGWQDGNGNSPFWEHLGKKFFGIGFQNADYMNAVNGTQFISDLMPRYPIYVDLLPPDARDVIGKPHTESARALSLLQREGFHFADYVDIFDGGPTVQCRTDDIHSVRQAQRVVIVEIIDDARIADTPRCIIANETISRYRIVRQPLRLGEGGAIIGRATARTLGCETGANVIFLGE
jgi:arginine N-succinyltransferase